MSTNPQLTTLGTYVSGLFNVGGAEIPAYDPKSQRAFVVNGGDKTIDILNLSDSTEIDRVLQIDVTQFGANANSVDVKNNLVAVAIQNTDGLGSGKVAFFDTNGNFLSAVEVGVLPDMLVFTPDGKKVVVANEGEPQTNGDPQGSVSIIDLSNGVNNLTQNNVANANFQAFVGQEDLLRARGVRIFPNKTIAEDAEPEFISIAPDGQTALVTLQENNAIAIVDLGTATVREIVPLGVKDWSNGPSLDASDLLPSSSASYRDEGINLQNLPIFGLYQPDAIASFVANGQSYYLIANEGDARAEDVRVKDIVLDPTAFPNAEELQQDNVLGRLKVSSVDGDLDGDGDYDKLFAYGGRSFSILDSTGKIVFDSGDALERIIAAQFPNDFNSDNEANQSFDSRSDDKGPEPEGVTVGVVEGRIYGFIGLERMGGVIVYDLTNPSSPEFVQYLNNRDFSGDAAAGTAGDLGPEGLLFVSAEDSPTGRPMLIVGNEVSGTTTVYDFGSNVILGTPGADDIEATDDDDLIRVDGGDDRVVSGDGDDVIYGGSGNDEIYSQDDDDRVFGGLGNDYIAGGGDDDLLDSGDGEDIVNGDAGDDTVVGGEGDDGLYGQTGNDSLSGGNGRDELGGDDGNDIIRGDAGDDEIAGDDGKDSLFGGTGDDDILGNKGKDFLVGGSGNDFVDGGRGKDVINGTDGIAAGINEIDNLIGGKDRDIFVLGDVDRVYYNGAGNLDYAIIKDFSHGDRLQLHGSRSDYQQQAVGKDVYIYNTSGETNELIAIVERMQLVDLNSNNVKFV
jgi:Ca2+-binding RTX toxin-like protein